MEAPDLYATLGVERTSSKADIRRGYRRAAKRAHPDVGGKRQDFDRVNLAHLVLCDDVRRAKYDQTGEVDEAAPDNEMSQIMQFITASMVGVVTARVAQRIEPENVDMVAAIRDTIRNQLSEIEKNKSNLKYQREFIIRSIKRILVKDAEPNRLVAVMSGHVASIDQALASCARNQEIGRKALELLKIYSSPAEMAGLSGGMLASATAAMWRFNYGP